MIRIYCDAADALLKETQTLTAGMINYPEVVLTFSDDWDGYGKAVVVRAGTTEMSVLVVDNKFTVPSECLANSGVSLIVGVSGSDGIHTIPTIWCSCGEIYDSVDVAESSNTGSVTPTFVDQVLGYVQDMTDIAEDIQSQAIRTVNINSTGADRYGVASVDLTDTGAGSNRSITFTFTNLKGNGIEALTFVSEGTNRGRVSVTLSDGTTTMYDGIKDALDYIDQFIVSDVQEFLTEWMELHPEWSLLDNAVTYNKLNYDLKILADNATAIGAVSEVTE